MTRVSRVGLGLRLRQIPSLLNKFQITSEFLLLFSHYHEMVYFYDWYF